jgi:hypothetical protein
LSAGTLPRMRLVIAASSRISANVGSSVLVMVVVLVISPLFVQSLVEIRLKIVGAARGVEQGSDLHKSRAPGVGLSP